MCFIYVSHAHLLQSWSPRSQYTWTTPLAWMFTEITAVQTLPQIHELQDPYSRDVQPLS